ncbi:MAG TPA: hypothetical protein VFV02_05120, partial [Acidimicrobiales bacterium]|nr:hypothetical protein [Acidimicrobiales bacterium]
MAADEFTEKAHTGAEQHRHQADAQLVDEAEVERLLDDSSFERRKSSVRGGGARTLVDPTVEAAFEAE